jgi:hypothetical protein
MPERSQLPKRGVVAQPPGLARGGMAAGLHGIAVSGLAATFAQRRLFYIVHSFFHFSAFFPNPSRCKRRPQSLSKPF